MRPALFGVLLWTSTWGSLLNSIPAGDTHLPSDTGSPSFPCGEHWQGMGKREERQELGSCPHPQPSQASLCTSPQSSRTAGRVFPPWLQRRGPGGGSAPAAGAQGPSDHVLGPAPLSEGINPLGGHSFLRRGVRVRVRSSSGPG